MLSREPALLYILVNDQDELCVRALKDPSDLSNKRSFLGKVDLVLIGFETDVGEFEILAEARRGMVELTERYPSIYRLENSRTIYRFGSASQLMMFRMTWEWI